MTDTRILYEPKTNIGLSTLLVDITYNGVITVPKSEVADVSVTKSFLSKKAIVTLKNGETLTFDNGAMSIDKVEAALRA